MVHVPGVEKFNVPLTVKSQRDTPDTAGLMLSFGDGSGHRLFATALAWWVRPKKPEALVLLVVI
jgi:hypothetical protein